MGHNLRERLYKIKEAVIITLSNQKKGRNK